MDVRSKNPGKSSRTAAGVNEPDCCINKGPLFLSVDTGGRLRKSRHSREGGNPLRPAMTSFPRKRESRDFRD